IPVSLRLLRPLQQLFPRVLTRGRVAEAVQRFPGRPGQLLRHLDGDGDQQVPVGPVRAPHTLAAHPERAAVRGPGRDADADRGTPQGRHLDLRAERRLGEGDGNGHGQVVAVAAEHRVRGDVDLDVKIARWPAALARGALALELDPLPVGDPGRDPRLDRAAAHGAPAARALRARVIDHQAAAPALLAGLGEREAAQVLAGLTGALAGWADPGHRSRLRPGAMTGRAGSLTGQSQADGDAVDRVTEPERGLRFHVRAAARPRLRPLGAGAAAAPEHPAEQVAEVEPPEAATRASRSRPAEAAAAEERARVVVFLAPLLIGERVVGL